MIIDLSVVDTTPGSSWAAPDDLAPDYTAWMRERYKSCRMTAQRLEIVARRYRADHESVTITGPYADNLVKIIRAINNHAAKKPCSPDRPA